MAQVRPSSTVRRELSWSHLKTLIYIDEPLKRDFYLEICRAERWSVRQLMGRGMIDLDRLQDDEPNRSR